MKVRDVNQRVYAKTKGFKVICISLYERNLEEVDAKVAELKRRGWTAANRSQVIRLAIANLDLDKLDETPLVKRDLTTGDRP